MVSRVKNVIGGSESLEMTRMPKVPEYEVLGTLEIPHLEDDVAEFSHLHGDTSVSMSDDGLAHGGTHLVDLFGTHRRSNRPEVV